MNKEKALMLLGEIVTFYLESHEDSADIEPTNKEILDAEKFIEKNLVDGEYIHELDLKDLTDIKMEGEIIDRWAIDGSQMESNVGEELLVVWQGEFYIVSQNWDEVVTGGRKVDMEELKEEGESWILNKINDYEAKLLSEKEVEEDEV